MTGRRRIDDRITRKEQEIQELETKIREARAYIQALQDVAQFLPKEGNSSTPSDLEPSLREGSYITDAKNAIQTAGRPLHIVEILKASGRENNGHLRIVMSGSLAAYVRRGEIFTRPRPNTFQLSRTRDRLSRTLHRSPAKKHRQMTLALMRAMKILRNKLNIFLDAKQKSSYHTRHEQAPSFHTRPNPFDALRRRFDALSLAPYGYEHQHGFKALGGRRALLCWLP